MGFFPSVCLVVLNWNGKNHLEELIPSLLIASDSYPGDSRVLILDNPSPSNDIAWIRERFPQVDGISAPRNDYLYSYNWLLKQLEEPVVLLLNNDLKVASGFIAPLVHPLSDPSVFSVGAKSLEWGGGAVTSAAYRLGIHHGCAYWDGFETTEAVYTMFTVGGFMAVDRLKFLALGGFDRLFHPAYGEDADLCLRAWARGWASVYQPASSVWHREGASWDGEQAEKREYLMTRAKFLFTKRYCRAWKQRFSRIIYMSMMTASRKKAGDHLWLKAIKEARAHWRKEGATALKISVDNRGIKNAIEMTGRPWIKQGYIT